MNIKTYRNHLHSAFQDHMREGREMKFTNINKESKYMLSFQ